MRTRQQRQVNNQPITLEQKRTLIATYQRTSNMSLAMRESGIRSPRTAYLWWHRFCEEGEAGLQARSHARKTQQTIPSGIAMTICQLRHVHPTWGRRRIAEALSAIYGRQVTSPSGVEAALRRDDLWEHVPEPNAHYPGDGLSEYHASWINDGRIDTEQLLAYIRRGLTLSFSDNAEGSLLILENQIWGPLQRDVDLWSYLMQTREIGKWLLRSRVALAHSLMNTGRWDQARSVLEETIGWMNENESWLHQQSWEDELSINLRWSDVWVECHQYLGIVLQFSDYERAQGYLQTALAGMQRLWRPVVPKVPSAMISNVRRDIASLKIRHGRAIGREIERDLERIAEGLEPMFLVPGKEAGIDILWAELYAKQADAANAESRSSRLHALEYMERAIERTLALVQQDPSPMLQANFLADAAELYHRYGLQFDSQLVDKAVHLCLLYGYRRQAEQLLDLPGIDQLVPDDILHQLIHLTL